MKVSLAIQIFKSSGSKFIQDFRTISFILFFPSLILITTGYLTTPLTQSIYVAVILRAIALTFVGVATIRLAVIGREPLLKLAVLILGVRGLRFLIFVVVLFLVFLVFKGLIDLSTELLVIFQGWESALTLLFSIFVLSRFLLVFPAAVLDKEITLWRSFRMTRAHYLSVFLIGISIVFACLLPIVIELSFPSVRVGIISEALGLYSFSYACINVSYLYMAITSKY